MQWGIYHYGNTSCHTMVLDLQKQTNVIWEPTIGTKVSYKTWNRNTGNEMK